MKIIFREYTAALQRLSYMARGIGDPLVSTYARCYLCRVRLFMFFVFFLSLCVAKQYKCYKCNYLQLFEFFSPSWKINIFDLLPALLWCDWIWGIGRDYSYSDNEHGYNTIKSISKSCRNTKRLWDNGKFGICWTCTSQEILHLFDPFPLHSLGLTTQSV